MIKCNAEAGSAAEADRNVTEFVVTAGRMLFREGDPKSRIYRIESGAICSYPVPGPDTEQPFSLSCRGDWLGFGYLDHHTLRARALVDTRVSCFPRSSVDVIVETDLRARRQLAEAIEREFELQRDATIARAADPLVRLSALLVSLASVGAYDGRDPRIIVEALPSGLVAECLFMSVATLAAALRQLQSAGLVEPDQRGLRIVDMAGLAALANGDGVATFPRTLNGCSEEVARQGLH